MIAGTARKAVAFSTFDATASEASEMAVNNLIAGGKLSDARKAARAVRGHCETLPPILDADAFGAVFDRFADAKVVLLGEASHGTKGTASPSSRSKPIGPTPPASTPMCAITPRSRERSGPSRASRPGCGATSRCAISCNGCEPRTSIGRRSAGPSSAASTSTASTPRSMPSCATSTRSIPRPRTRRAAATAA